MWKLMKEIFLDISSLYKNFLHFNLSKIIIFLVALLHVIIWVIPFIIVLWAVYYYYLSTWNIDIIDNYIFSFFVILGFFVMISSFLYYIVLQTNLNLSYIKGEKLWYLKNYYFNFKLFRNYFKLMILLVFILILPFIIYKALVFLSINIVWWEQQALSLFNSENLTYFKLFIEILWVITLLSFIYLCYKTLFCILILVDESKGEKFEKASYYIYKSFYLTKWFVKWLKFFLTFLIVVIISLPITIPLNYISFNNVDLSNYIEYKTEPQAQDKFSFYYLEQLKIKYANQDIDELKYKLNNNEKYELFLEILNFLFIFGLFEMMILSFYIRELKVDAKNNSLKPKSKNLSKSSIKKTSTQSSKAKTSSSTRTKTPRTTTKKPVAKKTSTRKTSTQSSKTKTSSSTKAKTSRTATKKPVAQKSPTRKTRISTKKTQS